MAHYDANREEYEIWFGLKNGYTVIDSIKGTIDGKGISWHNDTYDGDVLGVMVSITGEDGEALLEIKEEGRKVYLWHLYVPVEMRRSGVGTAMIDIFKQFVSYSNKNYVAGRVGNHGTKEFLERNGFPTDELHVGTVTEGKSRPMQSVAIGFGDIPINLEVAEAMEQAVGFHKRKLL